MHSSLARAETAARRLGCNVAPWAELERHIGDADIVISDAGTGRFTLGREQVAAALRRRRHRPVLLLDAGRSEEHTSELQSLMRTSYAVFCLKKNRNEHTNTT